MSVPAKKKATNTAKRRRSASDQPATGRSVGAAPAASAAGVRPRRPDAQRNRDRILLAAYEVFATQGVDAQMTDIATAADVGVATLYRNFETKEELVNALLLDHFARCTAAAKEAVREPDPWRALVTYLMWITSLQVEDRALSEFMSGRITGSKELQAERVALFETLRETVERAIDQGDVRRDIHVSDVRAVIVAVALMLSAGWVHERSVRRLVGVIIDGLRAPGQTVLEGPPVALDVLGPGPTSDDESLRAFKRGRRPWPGSAGR